MNVIEQMLARYPLKDDQSRNQALREVMQELALVGLNRGGFFDKAAFYGGTCLRIFYGLPRFSEDLDFSLLAPTPEFSLKPYFQTLKEEFATFGFDVEIVAKRKTAVSDVESAFLKKNSSLYDVRVAGERILKIKFEVDTDPPLEFTTQERLLLQPYSFYVKCFSLADLFAGKMHALLFRKWQNRVKGRDWYDLEWYVRQGCSLNLRHFTARAIQSGDLAEGTRLDAVAFQTLLETRIDNLDVASARADVARFLPDPQVLDIWSRDYFWQLAQHIRYL